MNLSVRAARFYPLAQASPKAGSRHMELRNENALSKVPNVTVVFWGRPSKGREPFGTARANFLREHER